MGKTIRKDTVDEYISEAESRKQAKQKKLATKDQRKKRKERYEPEREDQ